MILNTGVQMDFLHSHYWIQVYRDFPQFWEMFGIRKCKRTFHQKSFLEYFGHLYIFKIKSGFSFMPSEGSATLCYTFSWRLRKIALLFFSVVTPWLWVLLWLVFTPGETKSNPSQHPTKHRKGNSAGLSLLFGLYFSVNRICTRRKALSRNWEVGRCPN